MSWTDKFHDGHELRDVESRLDELDERLKRVEQPLYAKITKTGNNDVIYVHGRLMGLRTDNYSDQLVAWFVGPEQFIATRMTAAEIDAADRSRKTLEEWAKESP